MKNIQLLVGAILFKYLLHSYVHQQSVTSERRRSVISDVRRNIRFQLETATNLTKMYYVLAQKDPKLPLNFDLFGNFSTEGKNEESSRNNGLIISHRDSKLLISFRRSLSAATLLITVTQILVIDKLLTVPDSIFLMFIKI